MSQLQMGHNDDAIVSFQKSLLLSPRKVISLAGLTGAFYAAGRDLEAHNALIKWYELAVAKAGQNRLNDALDKDILKIKVELALLRLGRWPYTLDLNRSILSRALFSFQADEKLPQTGQPDEATLARPGIASQECIEQVNDHCVGQSQDRGWEAGVKSLGSRTSIWRPRNQPGSQSALKRSKGSQWVPWWMEGGRWELIWRQPDHSRASLKPPNHRALRGFGDRARVYLAPSIRFQQLGLPLQAPKAVEGTAAYCR